MLDIVNGYERDFRVMFSGEKSQVLRVISREMILLIFRCLQVWTWAVQVSINIWDVG